MEPAARFVEADDCPHNPDFECATCATARHELEHPEDVAGCRVCYFRGEIYISPAATPSRTRRMGDPDREVKNSWERGIERDHRGVPLMRPDGTPLGVKQAANQRAHVEKAKERNRLDRNRSA